MSSEEEKKKDEKESIIDQVMKFWEKDSIIDRHNAGEESANIPKIHYKYLNLLRQCNAQMIKLRQRKKQLYLDKSLYYNGKADPEVYRKDNFHHKVQKTDLDTFINGDDQYSRVIAKIEEYESLQEVLKSILNMIKDRNWQIRNIIEHDKFISGS